MQIPCVRSDHLDFSLIKLGWSLFVPEYISCHCCRETNFVKLMLGKPIFVQTNNDYLKKKLQLWCKWL